MNCCRETTKMGVPARHHARHASKARRAGHLATVPRYRGIGSEAYLNGTSQGSTPEDARLPARLRPVGDYAPEGRAYSSERRMAISVVAASNS